MQLQPQKERGSAGSKTEK